MKFRPLAPLAAPLAAALPLASAITLAPLAATAQETAQNPAVISVSATGSATVVPDMARLDLTVQRQAKTAR